MKNKSFYFILMLMGITMGFILAVQFRVTSNITKNSSPSLDRPTALAEELDKAKAARDELQEKMDSLRDQLDQAAGGPELAKIKESLDQARIDAGLTELQGPGVEVTLNDSSNVLQPGENPNFYVLHDGDVLSILNELKAAGAKAISINDQRLISTSEVRCIGPTILVNKNQRLSPPFVIYALGNPETLAGALKMKGGVVESLQNWWGIQVDVKKVDKVVISPYAGGLVSDFARPLK